MKKKEWKWSSDNWCWKSLQNKTSSSKWPNKNEEWSKSNTKDKSKDSGKKSSMPSEPKNN
jgi:hypothetical protein